MSDHPNVDEGDFPEIRGSQVVTEGVAVAELAEQFGTPLFVLSESRLRENLHAYQAALEAHWPDGPTDVLPAFKANTTMATRHILSEQGAGADVYSIGELEGVLASGAEPALVSVNGGGKNESMLRRCIEAGVRITVEDVDEVPLISRVAQELGATASVRLRCKLTVPSLDRKTDFSQLSVPIDMGMQVYKSGIPEEHVLGVARQALELPGIELVGLHTHSGRHSESLWYHRELMSAFARLTGRLVRELDGWLPSELDVGGGMAGGHDPHNRELPRSEFLTTAAGYPLLKYARRLGVDRYHRMLARLVPAFMPKKRVRSVPTFEQYIEAIAGTLRAELVREGVPTAGVRLQVEPGRSLYGDAGVHIAKVIKVKRQTQPFPYAWVLTDTSVFFLTGAALEHNRHEFVVDRRPLRGEPLVADLCGCSCFADQLVMGAQLPADVAEGDLVVLLDTGAYLEASASNFNAMPRPATVLVRDGEAELVRRAETVADVYARDCVPARLERARV